MTSLLNKMATYASTASWAVWPRADGYNSQSDLAFPSDDHHGLLHARTVVLGLNRGDSDAVSKPWANFHTAGRHNDHFLAEAFRGTPHWGAYMTDLLSEVNSKANTVNMGAGVVAADVADLIAELRLLEVNDPLFIVIGKQAGRAFASHESVLAKALRQVAVRWVEIPHYSAANGKVHGNRPDRYRELVHAALVEARED